MTNVKEEVLDYVVEETEKKDTKVDELDTGDSFCIGETKDKSYKSHSETTRLIKMAQDGDKRALEILVEDNVGLVWSSVGKFTNRGVENEDLFQIGAMGLIKCIKKFDISFNVRFSTYAVPMIIGEIKRFLRDDGIIKLSRPLKELAIKGRAVIEKLTKELGRSPTMSEVATFLNCDIDDLILSLEATRGVESLYATAYQGDGQPVLLIDKVEKTNIDNEDKIIDKISLKQIIGKLEAKERQIILLRYFNDKTQSDVATIIGVSQVQVSRIEKKVLNKMANMLES
ncbi:MAG: SigF/SigG family RNA polymerase sporulation sigma factor [Lachnospirales bacterium]